MNTSLQSIKMPPKTLPQESNNYKHLPPKPLSAFTRLSPKISLYTPSSHGAISSPPHHPTTILLCPWLNAAPKHIDYYARTYMTLYPAARIILSTITSNEFLFQSETRRQADVKEAVSALLAPDQAGERLFVHAFSNGGAKRCFAIVGAYQRLTGSALPARALLLDSAPGNPQFRRDLHALTIPVAKWPLYRRIPYVAVTLAVVCVVFVTVNWLPMWVWYDLVWRPTLGMNDSEFVPLSCMRGYIYSDVDLAIDYKDVEKHAAVAERKGYVVKKKLVEGAGHVQLFKGKGGEKDYWDFVTGLWDLGMTKQ